MSDYNYCCSMDHHGLSYPGFSVVFIQTFSIHHHLQLRVDERYVSNPDNRRASEVNMPMLLRDQSIERQIFVPRTRGKKIRYSSSAAGRMAMLPDDDVFRFTMRGFDFALEVPSDDDSVQSVLLSGHVSVEMSLFYGHTVSMTYRFFFDGESAKVTDLETGAPADAVTDHIIALLSTYQGAEFWSKDKEEGSDGHTDINLETEMMISNFWFSEDGAPLKDAPRSMKISGKGRTFDAICSIYKRFIYGHCTDFSDDATRKERQQYVRYRKGRPIDAQNDSHYSMVDIWENLKHVDSDGNDLFQQKEDGLSEAELVNHIRMYHKPELIGLMTLYPGEWPYRDAAAYDEVCGCDIAIDTDDLVLAGSNLSVVIGTYGRRGSAEAAENQGAGVDWTEHLKERAKYHVSWPEYLMILQIVLAKKYRIGLAKDQMVEVTMDAFDRSSEELIEMNSKLSMRLSRMIVQLDVIKYSKFASHMIMFERTAKRLGLEKDMEELREIISMVDNSLRNLSDYKEMKSDMFLNLVLAIISIASTFELLFQDSKMPFLEYFNIPSQGFAAWLVVVVAATAIFGLLMVFKNMLKTLWNGFIKG